MRCSRHSDAEFLIYLFIISKVELNRAILKNVGKRANRFGQVDRAMADASETGPRTISFPLPADFYDMYNNNNKKNNDQQNQNQFAQKTDELHEDQASHEEQRPNYEDADNDFLQQLKNY